LKILDDLLLRWWHLANGVAVLLNDGRNHRREFSTDMKPKNLESPHDAFIGSSVSQFVKKVFLFVGIICS